MIGWKSLAVFTGMALLASACGGSDYSGFESSEECLRAMPVARQDIGAEALADRCGVSEGMAEIALDAARVAVGPAGVESGPASEDVPGSSLIATSTDPEQSGEADSTTTTALTTTSLTTSTTALPLDGIEVPDVVGLDHQLAQDTMQFLGLRNLAEEDASGKGRRLIWDRNWLVVDQEPVAGSIVDKDTKITLFSLKDSEVDDQAG